MQLHGVLDMKAWFPINSSIIFVKEQGKSFLNIFKIAILQAELSSLNLAHLWQHFFSNFVRNFVCVVKYWGLIYLIFLCPLTPKRGCNLMDVLPVLPENPKMLTK